MAKRALQEINAGSMADIAFLLLIFFLVTTTMDQDSGIMRQLPPILDEPEENPDKAKEKNVFEVLVNANDQLLVEDDYLDVGQLKDKAIEFLTNKGVFSDEPGDDKQTERLWVRRNVVEQKIGEIKGYLMQEPDNNLYEAELKKFQSKRDAITFFGEYKELDKAALISLKNDNGTSYDMYIQIQNELTSALNQLRDELVEGKFGKTYLELDERDEKDRKIIKAVRQIFPQRVSEAEPNEF